MTTLQSMSYTRKIFLIICNKTNIRLIRKLKPVREFCQFNFQNRYNRKQLKFQTKSFMSEIKILVFKNLRPLSF